MSATAPVESVASAHGVGGKFKAFKSLVLLEHSVFALPFAYIAALTAMYRATRSVHWLQLLLITLAMIGARTFAMAVNRIIDREFDARNPRTAGRELVTGVLTVRTAWIGAVLALGLFLGSAAALNTLALALAPVAVIPLVVYPYGKRFTDVPHALLALAQAVGPTGAWIAVTGRWSWDAVVLGLAVGIWIGGFDLIFALQDIDTDRAQGLGSVPARWGVRTALIGARASHAVTTALFVWFGLLTGAGVFWWLGLVVVAGAFVYEHSLLHPDDLSRLNRAFFTVNGFVGIALFCFALLDLVTRGLRG
ncbi:menaquinone biosynthesis prenyltransferase MqnP [Actinocrinis puniceicyclus]|uniref:menaquinone biosynthesis prenyltransferase MqnP n=1 Tax=Actinocrinis puniceicyclus TaxID=977794 RepID=UPI0028A5EB27|nr:menaquinone biosynthesis prenyltransferase MqnP [Actinocrinis puniceicyclus]